MKKKILSMVIALVTAMAVWAQEAESAKTESHHSRHTLAVDSR